MTSHVIIFWHMDVMYLAMSVSAMHFLEILSILKALKFSFKGSYDKQNLTLMVILYEIYKTHHRRVS